VSSYRINRDGAFVGSTTGLTFHDVGLTPSTAYTWTVTAIDTAGQPSPATTISGTTPAIDTTAPSAPMASATGLNGSWVSLTWTAATDNVGVTGYVVYRDGSVFSTVGASTLQLRVSTGATYWVVAVDGAGNNSAPSNSVSI